MSRIQNNTAPKAHGSTISTMYQSFFRSLISRLAPSLASVDALAARRNHQVIPLGGGFLKRSHFQEAMERYRKEGQWLPKLLVLPNVGKFEIKLNAYNAALLANGIVGRYPSEITLYQNRNAKMNRYLYYSYHRLLMNRGNPKYWGIAINLIRNSNVYMISCLHSVNRTFYMDKDLEDTHRLIKRLHAMRANFFLSKTLRFAEEHPLKAMSHYIKFVRVYIPKTANSHRPLGVPTFAWRVYQKMWLLPLMGHTQQSIPNNFHGYLPGRGTNTAWKEILRNVIHRPNIYEVDFKGFFPSIPTDELSYFLLRSGLPLPVAKMLHHMNNSLPIYLDNDGTEITFTNSHQDSLLWSEVKLLLNKPKVGVHPLAGISPLSLRQKGAKSILRLNLLDRPYDISTHNLVRMPDLQDCDVGTLYDLEDAITKLEEPDYHVTLRVELQYEIMRAKLALGIPLHGPGSDDPADLIRIRDYVRSQPVPQTVEAQIARKSLNLANPGGIGLPQGANLSPYLSILYLEYVLKTIGVPKGIEYLFYADDGLFYGDNLEQLEDYLNTIFAPEPEGPTLYKYGIKHHPAKSKWTRRDGRWLGSLKYLGLLFTPAMNGAPAQLRADTREKFKPGTLGELLFRPKSTLLFDKHTLVFYTQIVSYLKWKWSSLASQATDNRKTWYVRKFWTHLANLKLYEFTPTQLDYLYLLSTLVHQGAASLLLFLGSAAQSLRDKASVYYLAKVMSSRKYADAFDQNTELAAQEAIQSMDFTDAQIDKMLSAVHWLHGSYEASLFQPDASGRLIAQVEHCPSDMIPSLELPVAVDTNERIDNLLKGFLAAPLFFGFDEADTLSGYFNIVRAKFRQGELMSVPLDLLRFFSTSLMQNFWYLGHLGRWALPTEGERISESVSEGTTRVPYYRAYHSLKYYIRRHTFSNLANSPYWGLILSRLYTGDWNLDSVKQDFSYKPLPGSLGDFINHLDMNIFIGSSYATHELVRLSSHLSRTPRRKYPFRLFASGMLPKDSWDTKTKLEVR